MTKTQSELNANDYVRQPSDEADAYVSGTSYAADSWVSFKGRIYLCKKATDGTQEPTNTEYWTDLTNVSARFSRDNTSLMGVVRYALASSDCTVTEDDEVPLEDRTTNKYTMDASGETYTFALPTAASGHVRDFLLVLTYTAGTLQLPSTIESAGDTLSFTAGKTYLLAFTEIGTKNSKPYFYIRSIELG